MGRVVLFWGAAGVRGKVGCLSPGCVGGLLTGGSSVLCEMSGRRSVGCSSSPGGAAAASCFFCSAASKGEAFALESGEPLCGASGGESAGSALWSSSVAFTFFRSRCALSAVALPLLFIMVMLAVERRALALDGRLLCSPTKKLPSRFESSYLLLRISCLLWLMFFRHSQMIP